MSQNDNERDINLPERDDKLEGGDIKLNSPFFKWLDNFLYHYKWHTVVALIVVFAIVICSVQMCQKTSYDAYIMYAGSSDIRMNADEGDVSEYQKLLSAMRQYVDDFDSDGERNISLLNLYLPSDEEMAKISSASGNEINLARIIDNTSIFKENIYYGPYQICFLSEHLVKEWTKDAENTPIASITPYLPSGESNREMLGEWGVYLRSTPLVDKPGFSLLGDDTVIVIRRMSLVSQSFNKSQNEENFRRSVEILGKMLSAK